MTNLITQIRDRIKQLLHGDHSDHPAYDSKISKWREYPLDHDTHKRHMHTGTKAEYGLFRVYYCYTCKTHYRAVKGSQPGWSTPWDKPRQHQGRVRHE